MSFELLNIRPQPIILGSTALGEISIEVEYGAASDVRGDITDLIHRLQVAVDTRRLVRAEISIARMDLPHPEAANLTRGKILGQVAFTLAVGDVGSTFLGVKWGGNHLINLVDPKSGFKSSFTAVEIQSGWLVRWGMVSGGIVLAFLLGVGAWWTDVLRRVLLRMKRRLPPPVGQAEVTSMNSKAPDPTIDASDDHRPPVLPPEVPGALLTALSESRAVLVLGEGASAQAGFPTGPAFLDRLLERLRGELPEGMVRVLTANDGDGSRRLASRVGGFSKIMDAIVSSVPRDRIVREIQDILAKVYPDPDFHEMLAGLPWCGVVSLSWDGFDESRFTKERSSTNGEWRRLTLDKASELPAAIRSGHRLFLRPFGDLSRPATLSLSMEEFRRNLQRWPEFRRQLGLLLQTQTFMFIGVSVDTLEQFLQSVASDLEVSDQRHFALVPDNRENEFLSSTLARFGVRVLPYEEGGDHRAVVDFVSSLAKSPRRSATTKKSRSKPASNEFASNRIEGVKLNNIGLFDTLELKFQTSPIAGTKSASWTVIFGANGCGKSSILRAIGLALAGNEATDAAGRLLQVGKNEGDIEVQFGSHVVRTRLVRDREQVIIHAGPATPVQGGLALVLGFPALRGAPSPNPRGASTLSPHNAEPADLLPMVNGEVDKRLGSFKQWLINALEQAARGTSRALAMKKLLDAIIRDVVPGEFKKLAPLDSSYVIKVKTDEDEKSSPDDVPFDDLSQGMASIFNWLGVLAQRLYDFYPDAKQPEENHAIVIIDEIDAHLHPDWQRRLVELTKKFFPNVQVLATSHSPLMAGALRGQELCVLERDPDTRQVGPLPVLIDTYGMRSQHILTSRIFGLSSDRNPDLEQRINRHVELVETLHPTPEQEEELEKLGDELQEFRYAGARPSRHVDPPTPEELETLRKHFEASAAQSVTTASRTEGTTS